MRHLPGLADKRAMRYNTKKDGYGTKDMDKVLRFLILAVLVGAAVVVGFFMVRMLFKLLVIGAIVIGIVALVRAWNRGTARG